MPDTKHLATADEGADTPESIEEIDLFAAAPESQPDAERYDLQKISQSERPLTAAEQELVDSARSAAQAFVAETKIPAKPQRQTVTERIAQLRQEIPGVVLEQEGLSKQEDLPATPTVAPASRPSRWSSFWGGVKKLFSNPDKAQAQVVTNDQIVETIQGQGSKKVFADKLFDNYSEEQALAEERRAAYQPVATPNKERQPVVEFDVFDKLRNRLMTFENSPQRLELLKMLNSAEATAAKLGGADKRASLVEAKINSLMTRGQLRSETKNVESDIDQEQVA